MAAPRRHRDGLDQDRCWYKSGVIYEVHVRAFYDTAGDGTGDFRGLTEKLDYIKDLGVTAVWVLPFYPSPLRDDGYDIADHYSVHPMYGTLADFKVFLREAHRRGLRVITELVLNHTSDQHPWFQRSRRARPGSRWRNLYVWSDDPRRYKDARIIFKDVETSNWAWDPVARAYFWHRFFSHQPDLNYDNPEVHDMMFKVVDFWFDLGVDGLRLDAVPYLFEREGTSCENLPETHAFLKKLRAHVDGKFSNRMLLAEANQWPEDAVTYFGHGNGDECHMAYHFPLMPRLFMALRMEDSLPIVDILEQTPSIPETSQWALFLRNHDELTLEMVTDEERDYMYRMYAQVHQARLNLGIRRRLAPLLGNDRKRIELLNALLFSLPGTPVLYYGDEIGLGENIYLGDRNGVRTPMQWSPDKNAGFSRANPQSLYLPVILDPSYHYEAVNVEVQLANPHSLLWWMRRLLALRKRWRALGEGKCEFLRPDNRKILSYVLRHEQETLLVVANLSRFTQPVELDLSTFKQRTPFELFGRTQFPVITDRPYFLSLGPHSFYWFSLETQPVPASAPPVEGDATGVPVLAAAASWRELVKGPSPIIETALARHLRLQPWFLGKRRAIKSAFLRENIPVPLDGHEACLGVVQVDYVEGDPEFYALPLAYAVGEEAAHLSQQSPHSVVARTEASDGGPAGVLHDALANPAFGRALLELILNRRRCKGAQGELEAAGAAALRRVLGQEQPPEPVPFGKVKNHSSLLYGDKVILKLFRRLGQGINPEYEIGRFLTENNFSHCLRHAGALEYVAADGMRVTLAVANAFVPYAKDAREFTLDALSRYYDRVTTWVAQGRTAPDALADPIRLLEPAPRPEAEDYIGAFLESARVLGVRTAELHQALASGTDADFAPEPFTPHYQRGLFQSMRNLAVETLRGLRRQLKILPPEILPMAQRVMELEPTILQRFRQWSEQRVVAKRIRIHGHCQLDQLLWTGRDFVFLDFEGDTAQSISERRIKRSPLRDVVALVRSLHYTAFDGLHLHAERGSIAREELPRFELWVRYWNLGVSLAYLRAYVQALDDSDLLPGTETELRVMVQVFLLHQMLGELSLELSRPSDRLRIPLQGVLYLTGESLPALAAAAGEA